MATLSHQQSRRMYSWWWDSHISPKNSKWLQENLTDMDTKVKQMIKLIEEDADSFARRAEMYYKKRPELMRLVEEFYRAYRALAERYDNATGVIRQAHRTMAEAFPNQVPLMADDSPAGSGASEGEPRTPEMTPPIRALLDPDELHQDASGLSSSHFHAVKRNGAFTEEPDSAAGRKGLKQLNNLFGSGEETQSHAKSAEGRARKGLNFHDAEAKEQTVQNGEYQNSKTRALSESERGDKSQSDILILKEALAKLEAEKDAGLLQYQKSVERLSKLESEVVSSQADSRGLNDRASQAEAEVQALKESLTKLEAEREASFLQYQQCLDRISNLESNISRSEENAGELNERVSKAENEAQAAKHALSVMKAEKEAIFVQYNECLEKISDLEKKLLEAEDDVRRINERADKAETEVETLKQALGKVEEEEKATSLQYQQCLETISSLERKLASAQEEAQRLNSEIGDGVAKLKGAEEHFLRLETSNQSLQSELKLLVQKMGTQSQELSEKQKELGRLWTCIQEERMRFMEAELAFQALQNLHSQSQEELRAVAAELQNRAQVLRDLEIHNRGLHEEVQKVKEENKSLNILNLTSVASIKNMQDELAGVRETNGKLQGEVELRVDQRNALQQEIYCLKEEINDLNKKHRDVLQQVDSVGLNPECLGSSVKELQEENSKLNEIFQREKSEKIALLEKLEIMGKLLEKNAFLENSLSDLNAEFEAIRGKVNGLEESCQLLLDEKSALVAENTTLFSQLKTTAENLGNISEKNAILENSLFDANAELEGFRAKVKSLEDSCQLLETEKSGLITEKESLVSELQISQRKLEELERRFTELEEKHSSLGREKESTLCKVEELRVALDVEKEEQAKLTQLSETRLAGLISQICLLQEEGWHRKKEFEEELDKAVNAQIEIFILQKFVTDLKENNYSLFVECQKLLQASKLSEKLVSKFQHENLEQQVEVKSLFDQIKKMRMWMHQVLKALDNNSDQGCGDKTEGDQILMDRILGKLEDKESSLSEALDENQKLVLEKSVLCTLLGQLRLEAANLEMEKNTLYQDLRTRTQEFLTLQSENHKLITMIEELKLNISDNVHKNVIQMTEIENLHANLLDLQGAYQNLQHEHSKVLEENGSLMKELSDAKEENYTLQEENHVISCEGISFNYLSLIFQNTVVEKSVELEELGENLDNEIAYGKDLLHQKEVELLEAEEKVIALQNEQIELQNLMEHLKREFDEVKGIKEDQEKQIHKLYEEVDNQNKKSESLCGLNQRLEVSLLTLQKEYEETKVREESLSSEVAKWRNEAEQWETEAAEFFSELQISAIREALFSEKLCELTEACQSLEDKSTSNVMEIDLLKERVGTLEDKNGGLKAQLDGYIPAFDSLRSSIVSLENYTLQNLKLYETENEQAKAESCGERNEDLNVQVPDGFSYLQELETRIKAIEKALMKTESLAAQDKLKTNMKFEEAMKQIEVLKSGSGLQKDNSGRGRLGKHGGELHDNSKPRKSVNEISETGNELLTKDIMLDQMSECSSYGKSRREIVEADGQMLELWETTDQNDSIDLKVGKAKKASADPTMHQQMKVVRKGKSRNPSSEILVEKELGVDKLEISKRFVEPRQEGNKKKILERLASDAQKLTNLQITVDDLKRKVEINEKSKKGKGIEYGSVKEQLEETEEAILKLFDINNKLTKNVEDDSISSEEKSAGDLDERESTRRRKVSEQARRGSEKIGRLQLEVQKLQFLLLKLDDEKESKGKTRIPGHKTRVLLRDYLYGGRRPSTHKQKKTRFCACVQPPTKGD